MSDRATIPAEWMEVEPHGSGERRFGLRFPDGTVLCTLSADYLSGKGYTIPPRPVPEGTVALRDSGGDIWLRLGDDVWMHRTSADTRPLAQIVAEYGPVEFLGVIGRSDA